MVQINIQNTWDDVLGVHVNSLNKYEAGQVQLSLDAIKKIAIGLHVSTYFLLFEEYKRSPGDALPLLL